jgi:hypothetical protein
MVMKVQIDFLLKKEAGLPIQGRIADTRQKSCKIAS